MKYITYEQKFWLKLPSATPRRLSRVRTFQLARQSVNNGKPMYTISGKYILAANCPVHNSGHRRSGVWQPNCIVSYIKETSIRLISQERLKRLRDKGGCTRNLEAAYSLNVELRLFYNQRGTLMLRADGLQLCRRKKLIVRNWAA